MLDRYVAILPYLFAFLVISTNAPLRGADAPVTTHTLALLVTQMRENGDGVCLIQRKKEEHSFATTPPKIIKLSSIAPIISKDFDYTLVHWAGYAILIPNEMVQETAANPITLVLTDVPIDDALEAFGKQFAVGIGSVNTAPPLTKARVTANIKGTSLWQSLAALMSASGVGSWDAFVSGPFPSLSGKPSGNTTRQIAVSLHTK